MIQHVISPQIYRRKSLYFAVIPIDKIVLGFFFRGAHSHASHWASRSPFLFPFPSFFRRFEILSRHVIIFLVHAHEFDLPERGESVPEEVEKQLLGGVMLATRGVKLEDDVFDRLVVAVVTS